MISKILGMESNSVLANRHLLIECQAGLVVRKSDSGLKGRWFELDRRCFICETFYCYGLIPKRLENVLAACIQSWAQFFHRCMFLAVSLVIHSCMYPVMSHLFYSYVFRHEFSIAQCNQTCNYIYLHAIRHEMMVCSCMYPVMSLLKLLLPSHELI